MQVRRVLMLVANRLDIDGRVQRSAQSLATHGYEVTVVARAPGGERRYELDGYRVVEVPFEAAPPVDQRCFAASCRTSFAVSTVGGSARLVWDAHQYAMGKRQKPGRREQLGAYLRANVPAVDAVITVSEALAETLAAELPLPVAPVLVHNAPSLRDRRPPPYALREAIGVDRETPVIVYAGGVNVHRRLDTVMAAVARLPGAHLALVVIDAGLTSPCRTSSSSTSMRDCRWSCRIRRRWRGSSGRTPWAKSRRSTTSTRGRVPSSVLANRAAYTGDREHLCLEWSWEAQEARLLEVYERLGGVR